MICDNCKDWGHTITHEENSQAIPCPKCKRLTWPNLGVNCPAGSAVALAACTAMMFLSAIERRMK